MNKTDIAKITGLSERTVQRVINGHFKRKKKIHNVVEFYRRYDEDLLQNEFRDATFGAITSIVIEKANRRDHKEYKRIIKYCVQLNKWHTILNDTDYTLRDPLIMDTAASDIMELFLDEDFGNMCDILYSKTKIFELRRKAALLQNLHTKLRKKLKR